MLGARPCSPRARQSGQSAKTRAGSAITTIVISCALLTIELRQLLTDPLPRRLVDAPRFDRRRMRAAAPPPHRQPYEDEAPEQARVRDHPHEQAEALPWRL